jgi:hypothetical protein
MFKILGNVFADKGFYINLESSKDRKEHVENLISKFEIEGLHRFDALSDELIQYSCTKSHLGVFRQSLDEDLDIIFVGEDDFDIQDECFLPTKKEKTLFSEVLGQIKIDLETVEWDVLLFGCNPRSHVIPITNNLGIIHKSTGAWAYLIKKKAYSFLLENLNYKKDYIAIDDYLPLLNDNGFTTIMTIPLIINHGIGFESVLQPRGPVNYTGWIQGNYCKFLYENYKEDFNEKKIEKDVTIVITGHFVKNYLYYLQYLIYSLPDELRKCKFLVHYDESLGWDSLSEHIRLKSFFRDYNSELNVTLSVEYGGLINSINSCIKKIKTPYFILLEHDWVFLEKNSIDFKSLADAFNNNFFINAVWFSKDDNTMRGFDIAVDVENNVTPFDLEKRVTQTDLITVCRWSNNPAMFRVSKMKEWFTKYIDNGGIGKIHQGQHNVEETMIPIYRKIISENKWEDIRDDWGTFLYGKLGQGPYVAHTDASQRYQGVAKSLPEINGEEFIKNNPLYGPNFLQFNLVETIEKIVFKENTVEKLIDIYNKKCNETSDINQHLPILKKYSDECDHITEMGVRDVVSTYAFLMGNPSKLISYDLKPIDEEHVRKISEENNIEFIFKLEDTTKCVIEETDLLFVDTLHNYNQLKSELSLHSNKVKKYIIMHDTTTFEYVGESYERKEEIGLWPAVEEFLENNLEWKLHERFTNNNGLTILKKNE